jgi:hypothetical protein
MTEKSNAPKKARKSRAKGRGGKRRGAGRPAFRPTIEQRQTVEEMKFCGDSDEVIARAIGIDTATLAKHFAEELLDGYAQRRREVVSLMFKEARAGNASAIRRLEEIGRMANSDKDAPAKPAAGKPGKKQVQQEEAQSIASEGIFSPPAGPRIAAVNGQIVA